MDAKLAEQANEMIRAGISDTEAAKWRVEMTNELKKTFRTKGYPIVDIIAKKYVEVWIRHPIMNL